MLAKLFEKLFLLICRIRREAQAGTPTAESVKRWRQDVMTALREIRTDASKQRQGGNFDKVLPVVCAFVDVVMIRTVPEFWKEDLIISREHFRDGYFVNGFIQWVADDLKSTDPDAEDRFEVYYGCVSLGGHEVYSADGAAFKHILEELKSRLEPRMDSGTHGKLVPQAYDVPPFAGRIDSETKDWFWYAAIPAVVLSVGFLFANWGMYRSSTARIETSLKAIDERLSAGSASGDKPAATSGEKQ